VFGDRDWAGVNFQVCLMTAPQDMKSVNQEKPVSISTTTLTSPGTCEFTDILNHHLFLRFSTFKLNIFGEPNLDQAEPAANDMSSIYVHQLEENELRLLEILPKEPGNDEIIKCKLHHNTYAAEPEFTALSYAWGDSKVVEDIDVDGKTLQVTTNLMAALKEMRVSMHENNEAKERELDHFDGSTLLWIDAICLNQKDDIEKGRQVRHMDKVYQNARTVLVWLGEEDKDTNVAIQEIERFSKAILESTAKSSFLLRNDYVGLKPTEYSAVTRLVQEHILPKWEDWLGVRSLLNRPYFSRLWVIQEAALASHAVIACGHFRLLWNSFRRCFITLGGLMSNSPAITEGLRNLKDGREVFSFIYFSSARCMVRFASSSWKELSDGQSLEMAFLSLTVGQTEATDPRDQVYGLLSLMPDDVKSKITVRYDSTWTIKQLYTQTTGVMIQDPGGFDTLQRCAGLVQPQDVPSWTLDWRYQPQIAVLDTRFRASFGWKRQPQSIYCDVEAGELKTQCIVVSLIKSVLPPCPHYYWNNVSSIEPEELGIWVRALRVAVAKDGTVAKSSNALDAAVVRLCTLGMAYNGKMVSSYKSFVGKRSRFYRRFSPSQWLKKSSEFLHTYDGSALRPFISKSGHCGLARNGTEPGDLTVLFPETRTPFILRPSEHEGKYQLVGNAYVDGIMYGEFFDINPEAKPLDIVLF
jgi:hypothetical protein